MCKQGVYSWLIISHHSDLKTVSFDPELSNVDLLQKPISKAKLKQAHLITSAVSDKTGEATFATDNISSATGTLEVSEQTFVRRHYEFTQDLIRAEPVTLANVWRGSKMSPPDFIEIGVEGAEKRVFNGGMELIQYKQPVMIFECFCLKKMELVSRLKSLGYKIFDAEKMHISIEEATNLLALPSYYIHIVETFFAVWQKPV